jgi:predicted transglutaminase-like cysteine proteinase
LQFLALLAAGLVSACAAGPATTMPLAGLTTPPAGATLFCATHAEECPVGPSPAVRVAMTPELWSQLREVHRSVNAAIKWTEPDGVAWHYAKGPEGACVQFAMEKRRALLQRGWPAGALQFATAITPENEGHLVLVVATTEGDWVLDSRRRDVTAWDNLPYRWMERQESGSMWNWARVASAGQSS